MNCSSPHAPVSDGDLLSAEPTQGCGVETHGQVSPRRGTSYLSGVSERSSQGVDDTGTQELVPAEPILEASFQVCVGTAEMGTAGNISLLRTFRGKIESHSMEGPLSCLRSALPCVETEKG